MFPTAETLRSTPQVASSHHCLETLAGWIRWAVDDRQTTILRLILGVLLRLPMPPTMLRIGRLFKSVSSLQSYKCVTAVPNY